MLQDMLLTASGRNGVSNTRIIEFFKGVFRRLFPIKDIQTALKIKPAITSDMMDRIRAWQDCYSGKAEWVKDEVISIRLESSITKIFSDITINEMTASVTVPKLDEIFKNAIRDLNMNLQEGFATGAMVIKPLGGDKVQYVSANRFIPIEYDSRGRLVKVIFPEFKKLGDSYYTRLEYHDLDTDNGLTITNTAYISDTPDRLGSKISLETVEEWADLEDKIRYPLMKAPAFGYFRTPIKNTIDGSHCGVSIFDSATGLIKQVDIMFSMLNWEFESAERRINVDRTALKQDKNGNPILKDKIFRAIDVTDLCQEFSPQIRVEDFIKGIEKYLRMIEFTVGLAYGDLSNTQNVDKTAAEVRTSKERKYNTVTAIQKNLQDCLEDLVYALAFYNSMTKSGYKFICDFKDSIRTDDETEREQDRKDLANGTLRLEEYRAKWRGEDIETARNNLPPQAEVL